MNENQRLFSDFVLKQCIESTWFKAVNAKLQLIRVFHNISSKHNLQNNPTPYIIARPYRLLCKAVVGPWFLSSGDDKEFNRR